MIKEKLPQLISIPLKDKEELKQILVKYLSELYPNEIAEYPYLDTYWSDSKRLPFYINFDNKVIGFVLINDWIVNKDYNAEKSIAEFYICPPYRQKGIGKIIVQQLIKQYKEKWEIRVDEKNKQGVLFWRKTIEVLTKNRFIQTQCQTENKKEIIYLFDTSEFLN